MASFRRKIEGRQCPKCTKETIFCEVKDKGASDYYLQFVHRCVDSNCDFAETAEGVVWSSSPVKEGFVCPLCSFDYSQHLCEGKTGESCN